MNSSGIKRGLAVSAVAALAVTGIQTSASAVSVSDGLTGGQLSLFGVTAGGTASTQTDGVNKSVHLLAVAGADVTSVVFTWTPTGGAAVTIAEVSGNKVFSTEWTPAVGGGDGVVSATSKIGTTTVETKTAAITVSETASAISIGQLSGSDIGLFDTTYGGVTPEWVGALSGTTYSGIGGSKPQVWSSVAAMAVDVDVFAAPTVAPGVVTWAGTVSAGNYAWDSATIGAVNELIVGVSAAGGAQDAQYLKAYKQEINDATVVASDAFADTTAGTTAGGSVTVTVVDQFGAPVAGASVGLGSTLAVTDGKGQHTFSGLTAGVARSTTYDVFIERGTKDSVYTAATDLKRSAAVTSYVAETASIEVTSKKEAVLLSNYADAELTLVAKDQKGKAIAIPANTVGQWSYKPFPGDSVNKAKDLDVFTLASGTISNPATAATPGTYTLRYWLETGAATGYQAGEVTGSLVSVSQAASAEISFSSTNGLLQSSIGTEAVGQGKIVLEGSDVALGNHAFTGTYTKAIGGDAKLTTVQPVGTSLTGVATVSGKSAADGSFSVKVADPVVTSPVKELGGSLSITPSGGSAGSLVFDFMNLTVADVSLVSSANLIDSRATPGRPVATKFRVTNVDGDPLNNVSIAFATDHGFFTSNKGVAPTTGLAVSPTEAGLVPVSKSAGALFGEWETLGASTSVKTDRVGEAWVTVAVGKDAEFEEASDLDAKVTGTSATKSGSGSITFNSSDPLNAKELTLAFAKGGFSDAVLPNAQAGQSVPVDVRLRDQFGNPVSNNVALETEFGGSTASVSVNGNDTYSLRRSVAGDEDLRATVSRSSDTWQDDADPATTVYTPIRTSKALDPFSAAVPTVKWYEIDFAKSKYEVSAPITDAVAGKLVTLSYSAVDQFGLPVEGADVEVYRSDSIEGGESVRTLTTDKDGKVRYTYQAVAGQTQIQFVLVDGDVVIADSIKETSVAIKVATPPTTSPTKPPVVKPPVKPAPAIKTIAGKNNGSRSDVITVTGTAGTKVTIYRWSGAKKIRVKTITIGKNGSVTLSVKDRNKGKATKYGVQLGSKLLTKKIK